jgi:hypothetical protein
VAVVRAKGRAQAGSVGEVELSLGADDADIAAGIGIQGQRSGLGRFRFEHVVGGSTRLRTRHAILVNIP